MLKMRFELGDSGSRAHILSLCVPRLYPFLWQIVSFINCFPPSLFVGYEGKKKINLQLDSFSIIYTNITITAKLDTRVRVSVWLTIMIFAIKKKRNPKMDSDTIMIEVNFSF